MHLRLPEFLIAIFCMEIKARTRYQIFFELLNYSYNKYSKTFSKQTYDQSIDQFSPTGHLTHNKVISSAIQHVKSYTASLYTLHFLVEYWRQNIFWSPMLEFTNLQTRRARFMYIFFNITRITNSSFNAHLYQLIAFADVSNSYFTNYQRTHIKE